jgi:hypothetical protein
MNRRRFLKSGALWVPPLFAIGRARGAVLTLADPAMVGRTRPVAGSSFTYYATAFDSSTPDYMTISGTPAFSDAKTGLLSFWIKTTSGDGNSQRILMRANTDFIILRTTANAVRIQGYNGDGATLSIRMTTTATVTAGSGWHHVLMNWDTSNATNCWCVVDGTEGTALDNRTDATVDYTFSGWYFGYSSSGLDADVCEFYFAPGQSLGAYSSANVQKFRSTGAQPVDLGSDGSTPTGSQPGFYLKNPYSSFETNSGSGGNFTVSGTLASATAP